MSVKGPSEIEVHGQKSAGRRSQESVGWMSQTLHSVHARLQAGNPYRSTHRLTHAGRWLKEKPVSGSWWRLTLYCYTLIPDRG